MKANDAVPGTILVAFAAAVFAQTFSFPPMPGQDYGSRLFPQVIAVLLAICGLVLIARGVAARRREPLHREPLFVAADWMRSPQHLFNFLLLIAALLFYIFVSGWLGFIPTAFLILAVLMIRLRGRGHLVSSLAIAALGSVVIQQFFGQLLRVPLPWGLVPPFYW